MLFLGLLLLTLLVTGNEGAAAVECGLFDEGQLIIYYCAY